MISHEWFSLSSGRTTYYFYRILAAYAAGAKYINFQSVYLFLFFFSFFLMFCLTASCEKQLKDKLQRRNFARLCVFERMPGIFRVNGTGPVDRWCGRQVAAVRFCCYKNCILYDESLYSRAEEWQTGWKK